MPQRLKAMVIDIKTKYNITVLHLSADLNFTANLLSRYFVPSQRGITSKKQTKKALKMNMKPMILDKEQQISFISMCNNAMDDGHKDKKSEQHKNKASKRATRKNGRTEK